MELTGPGPGSTLVPPASAATLSYYCTWLTQNLCLRRTATGGPGSDPARFAGKKGSLPARDNLTEEAVFGNAGWASRHFASIRADLLLVLDDGWDVPFGVDATTRLWEFGSLEVDPVRFPTCDGSPPVRLGKLSELARSHGWRGLGIWVAAQVRGDLREGKGLVTEPEALDYWRTRADWSRRAEIKYWKVDWGARWSQVGFRRALTDLAESVGRDFAVEHSWCMGPLNDWQGLGRFRTYGTCLAGSTELLGFAQVVRAYDVMPPLSTPTMLDRLCELFVAGKTAFGIGALINAEDEVYLGAALGCSLGIMRHPSLDPLPGQQWDLLDTRHRGDEVVRAVRWQRIAPPVSVALLQPLVDSMVLADRWVFESEQTWLSEVAGREVEQKAPARFARGMPLPEVHASKGMPYVVASRHPNGAVAVATLPRTMPGQPNVPHRARVEVDVGDPDSPIGVFGDYGALVLRFRGDVSRRVVLAQDLASDTAVDVTSRVHRAGRAITLDGDLITQIGRSASTPGDRSYPGLVLRLNGEGA